MENRMAVRRIRILTMALSGIVVLFSLLPDADHRPPAGSRAAIELVTDSLPDSRTGKFARTGRQLSLFDTFRPYETPPHDEA